jgi:glucose uptake protein GlcU
MDAVRETTSVTRAIRIGAPAALLGAGLVLVFAFGSRESEAAGYTLLGSSALLVLSILIFRAGLASNADRDREEAARVFFDEHGRWPRRAELDERFGSGAAGKDSVR